MLGGREKPMDHRTKRRRSSSRSAAVALTVILLAGCASTPPAQVTSIEPLVGKWAGTVQRGGPQQFFYLTVNPDQTLVATWGITWSTGRITVANGQATYEMSPPLLEGIIRFYPGDDKPTMYLDDLFADFHAIVTRQP